MNTQPTENELNFIESHIPELAEVAFKQAFWQTLADGVSVMIAENNHLVEVSNSRLPPAQLRFRWRQTNIVILRRGIFSVS